jgi:hypothetical protein
VANTELSSWTIYDRPKDYPHGYIARRFVINGAGPIPTDEAIVGPIEQMRTLFESRGLVCFPLVQGDEPQIVETWM